MSFVYEVEIEEKDVARFHKMMRGYAVKIVFKSVSADSEFYKKYQRLDDDNSNKQETKEMLE